MNATVPLDELYDNLDQQGIEVFHCSTKEVVAVHSLRLFLLRKSKKPCSSVILLLADVANTFYRCRYTVLGEISGKHRGSLRL